MEKLHWFLVKIIFEIKIEGRNSAPQFEEQFRLIKADELEWAIEKATILSKMEESAFLNDRNQKVEWEFVKIVELLPLEGIDDGMQLYAQTEEPENVNAYLEVIKRKANQLTDKLKKRKSELTMSKTNTQFSYF